MPKETDGFGIINGVIRTFRDQRYIAIEAARQLAGRVLAEIGRQLRRSADGDMADRQRFSRP